MKPGVDVLVGPGCPIEFLRVCMRYVYVYVYVYVSHLLMLHCGVLRHGVLYCGAVWLDVVWCIVL